MIGRGRFPPGSGLAFRCRQRVSSGHPARKPISFADFDPASNALWQDWFLDGIPADTVQTRQTTSGTATRTIPPTKIYTAGYPVGENYINVRIYDSTGTEEDYIAHPYLINGLAVHSSGFVLSGGESYSSPNGGIRKYNSSGDLEWDKNQGTTYCAAIDSGGNCYVGGVVNSSITTRVYDPDGNLLNNWNHNGNVRAIAINKTNTYFCCVGDLSSDYPTSYTIRYYNLAYRY